MGVCEFWQLRTPPDLVVEKHSISPKTRAALWSTLYLQGAQMTKFLEAFTALLLAAVVSSASPKPQSGTILSQTSVGCGTKKSKKQDIDLLCHQYVVHSGSTDYTIRQPKPDEQHIIPLNTPVQFTIDKNMMKFKANGRSFKFMVVSQAAASSATDKAASSSPNQN
jgi:hypothetical protein